MTHKHRTHIGVFILILLLITPALTPFAHAGEGRTLAAEMQALLEQTRSRLMSLRADLTAGRTFTDADRADMAVLTEDLEVNHLLLDARMQDFAGRAATLGGAAASRQADIRATYNRVLPPLLELLHQLCADTQEQTDVSFTELVDDILLLLGDALRPAHNIMIHGLLPVRPCEYPTISPTTEPAIVPAYAGGDIAIAPADTEPAPEVQITEAIADLAASLDWNPVNIYEYVKNNIATQFYHGCMKGASQTLAQQSGNDADQAALLIALFRAAGYPARYVKG
ncbi:MAG: transglutaminase-like domain-containing protein, partial [Thermodesulfobacteriota bacterium]|nr:transglutaminase-like domain-containing protein [Thermodesulfobacteriota bacterium]